MAAKPRSLLPALVGGLQSYNSLYLYVSCKGNTIFCVCAGFQTECLSSVLNAWGYLYSPTTSWAWLRKGVGLLVCWVCVLLSAPDWVDLLLVPWRCSSDRCNLKLTHSQSVCVQRQSWDLHVSQQQQHSDWKFSSMVLSLTLTPWHPPPPPGCGVLLMQRCYGTTWPAARHEDFHSLRVTSLNWPWYNVYFNYSSKVQLGFRLPLIVLSNGSDANLGNINLQLIEFSLHHYSGCSNALAMPFCKNLRTHDSCKPKVYSTL